MSTSDRVLTRSALTYAVGAYVLEICQPNRHQRSAEGRWANVTKMREFFTRFTSRIQNALEKTRLQPDQIVPTTALAEEMWAASLPSISFFLMLSLSAVIATLGLIANSAPAIVGAMIIAPLMAPIISAAYGIASEDWRLVVISSVTVVLGTILVVAIANTAVLVFGVRIVGSEVLSRTSPSMLDLGVALAAGCAGAVAQTRYRIGNSVAGVAIAVALVPPLAVTGIGLALGDRATSETGLSLAEFGLYSGGSDIAVGAFILFATNLIGIVLIACLIFIVQGYGRWRQMLTLVVILALGSLLLPPLNQALHEIYVKNRVARMVAKDRAAGYYFENAAQAKIEKISVNYRDGILVINVDGFATEETLIDYDTRLDTLRKRLSAEIGEPVILEVDVVLVDIREYRSVPTPVGADAEPSS